MEFPPLDLADMSFDLGLPEFAGLAWSQPASESQSTLSTTEDSFMEAMGQDINTEAMDVDQDVADWLDSLLPNNSAGVVANNQLIASQSW